MSIKARYVPQTPGELIDQLGAMMLDAPDFADDSGYWPHKSIETEFLSLNGGLDTIRKQIGEDQFKELRAMSDRMRALFEADSQSMTGETRAGRELIDQMQKMLRNRSKPSRRHPIDT
jgi:hypothetical protein